MNSPKVIVVGDSYSSACAFYFLQTQLPRSRQPFEIILISDKGYYSLNFLLYQSLGNSCDVNEVGQDFRGIGLLRLGVSYLSTKVLDIDFKRKIIKTTDLDIEYNYLILAPDNDENDFELKFKKNHYFQIKSLQDILKIKNQVLLALEQAVRITSDEERKKLLTFSIIGSKKEGIQVISNLYDHASILIKERYPELKKSLLSFNLIEEKDSIGLSKDLIYNSHIFYNLKKKGINLYLNSKVTSIEKGRIEINNDQTIISNLIIFSGKSKRSSLIQALPLSKDDNLSSCVDFYYKAQDIDNVFVIGESSKCLDITEDIEKLKSIDFLYEQAKTCAYNVVAKINNTLLKPAKHQNSIDFLSLGSKNSLIQIRGMCFEGFFIWLICRLIYIRYLLGFKKKITSLVKLFLNVFSMKEYELIDFQDIKKEKQVTRK